LFRADGGALLDVLALATSTATQAQSAAKTSGVTALENPTPFH
jgi:hypothetical protein